MPMLTNGGGLTLLAIVLAGWWIWHYTRTTPRQPEHAPVDETPTCVIEAVHDAPLGAWLAHSEGVCSCHDDLDRELAHLLDRPYDHESDGL